MITPATPGASPTARRLAEMRACLAYWCFLLDHPPATYSQLCCSNADDVAIMRAIADKACRELAGHLIDPRAVIGARQGVCS